MKYPLVLALLTAAVLVPPGTPLAGEVIGNTYISEKDGVIEFTAEAWNIKDTETPGKIKLAELTPKSPIKGYTPSIQVNRLANPGGQIAPDWFLQQIRAGLEKEGAEVAPIETRRIAGKRVLAMQATMTRDGGKANVLFYMLQGEKSLYWTQLAANVNAWDEARQMFDEFMEKVKY